MYIGKTFSSISLFCFAQSQPLDSFHSVRKPNQLTLLLLYTISPSSLPLPPHLRLAIPCPLEPPDYSLNMSPSLTTFVITTHSAAGPLESLWVFVSHILGVYLAMTIFVVIGPKIAAPIDFEVA